MCLNHRSDPTCQEKPLTGFLIWVGLASGVRQGIQKLGRLWLEVAAEAALEDSAELLSVLPFSLPLFCPEGEKPLYFTLFYCLTLHLLSQITVLIITRSMRNLKQWIRRRHGCIPQNNHWTLRALLRGEALLVPHPDSSSPDWTFQSQLLLWPLHHSSHISFNLSDKVVPLLNHILLLLYATLSTLNGAAILDLTCKWDTGLRSASEIASNVWELRRFWSASQ